MEVCRFWARSKDYYVNNEYNISRTSRTFFSLDFFPPYLILIHEPCELLHFFSYFPLWLSCPHSWRGCRRWIEIPDFLFSTFYAFSTCCAAVLLFFWRVTLLQFGYWMRITVFLLIFLFSFFNQIWDFLPIIYLVTQVSNIKQNLNIWAMQHTGNPFSFQSFLLFLSSHQIPYFFNDPFFYISLCASLAKGHTHKNIWKV